MMSRISVRNESRNFFFTFNFSPEKFLPSPFSEKLFRWIIAGGHPAEGFFGANDQEHAIAVGNDYVLARFRFPLKEFSLRVADSFGDFIGKLYPILF